MGMTISLMERRSVVTLAMMSTSCALSEGPPIAKIKPKTVYFGKVEGEDRGENPMDPPKILEDGYFWMRDDKRKDAEILKHLEKENAFTHSQTAHLESSRQKLYAEMLGHLKEDDESVPFADGSGFVYWWRTKKGKSYKEYWRKQEGSDEQCYLDVNAVAEKLDKPKMCDVSEVSPSPQGTRIAYTVDSSGYETYEIRILDAINNEIIETIENVAGSITWGKNENILYYTRHDKAHRPYQVFKHEIASGKSDTLIFQDDDNLFNVEVWRDLDATVFILSASKDTSEIHFIDTHDNLQLVRAREVGVEYTVASAENDLYIIANNNNQYNRALYFAKKKAPVSWHLLVPTSEHRSLSDQILATKHFVVVTGREDGFARVWLLETDKETSIEPKELPDETFLPADTKKKDQQNTLKLVPPPKDLVSSEAYFVCLDANAQYNTESLRLCFSTMKLPKSIVDFFPKTNKHEIHKIDSIPNYDASLYRTERLLVDSRDGRERIPLTLLWRPDLKVRGVHLYSYGSYSISLEPIFASSRLPLVDRGIVYAIAHVRGGGEMGKHNWYETQGKYKTKKNTFYDFIDCAKHIKHIVYPNAKISIEGRSAGGLLVGNACNLEPSLFEACLAGVPFVDLMVTMCDPSIPLTTEEWKEWGNPNQAEFFDYMLSYSPINNIIPNTKYPKMLIVSGLNDPRVAYWEPAKWAQCLRSQVTNPNDILLKMDMDSGHFSAADRYSYLRDTAYDYAWLLSVMLPSSDTTLPDNFPL
eukprot:CAMPEP_0197320118 /NCGR_PEP_ID=MMETSP0891-20130614/57760_1 /TAXON_ID=44058 ORGANISM="Aureoumbra lagunensis, Strain CCMP1510" /NCGR_SAMPLE_ID=MMETSP0891 /ASSEMBLY_ACC=CAM_ASM_000534 /LENGTH=756 /DNA_ID=CAMNT_0042811353 /DNA_START=34 /DNA_END=2304 /DNA_ORIENTATION=-